MTREAHNCTIIANSDPKIVCSQVAALLRSSMENLADEKITIALPGGRSILLLLDPLFEEISTMHLQIRDQIRFFMVDERLVPIFHEDSNYRLLNEGFYSRCIEAELITSEQIFPFIYNADEEGLGTAKYKTSLDKNGGRFTHVILGVGEDGHVAGLFPHHPVLQVAGPGFSCFPDSPKPPAMRMTANADLIRNADAVILLFLGEGKTEALQSFFNPEKTTSDCPARIALEAKNVFVVTDLKDALGVALA